MTTSPFLESTIDSKNEVIRVSLVVPAAAKDIFDLLASPAGHAVIDGSGTVRSPQLAAPDRLSLGAKFGMDMKKGVPYKITNEVVEFEENARIAWSHFGGHIWRYVLEPQADGGTKVTEEFDWKTNRSKLMLKVINAFSKNHKSMEQTLIRMRDHFANK
ncbi:MAG: dimethyladenosine transferase [Actinomycetota bacterium]